MDVFFKSKGWGVISIPKISLQFNCKKLPKKVQRYALTKGNKEKKEEKDRNREK